MNDNLNMQNLAAKARLSRPPLVDVAAWVMADLPAPVAAAVPLFSRRMIWSFAGAAATMAAAVLVAALVFAHPGADVIADLFDPILKVV
ncbi:MAG: hypothetical protein ABFD92_18190 [Planctomycetaceae bacterium]|nr:hypothetical protein [Planctomycetaceae bacterium]